MARTTIRTEDVTDSEVTTAKMATDPTDASTLASGTVPTARLGSGTASSSTFLTGAQTYAAVDTSGITANQEDIALLGFKVAANGSLARYNLVDQSIDAFEDASGVDASASTNEIRDAANYYSGTESANYWGDETDGSLVTSGDVTHTVLNKNGGYDGDMVVMQYTALTISSGDTMTTDQPCRGMLIYVAGDCTIDGTLSMETKGAYANPTASGGSDSNAVQAAGLQWPMLGGGSDTLTAADTLLNGCGTEARTAVALHDSISSDGTIFSAVRQGENGGAGSTTTVANAGVAGTGNNTTGGGGGGARYNSGTSGAGAYGSCFTGGSGGAGIYAGTGGGSGTNWGGPGGDGRTDHPRTSGGAGHPGGTGGTAANPGVDGTGGLIVLFVKGDLTIGASGVITAVGSAGGDQSGGTYCEAYGGGSGGGLILCGYGGTLSNSGSITVAGGRGGTGVTPGAGGYGGAGGAGDTQVTSVTGESFNNMTLISNAQTAEAVPTNGDLVITYTNGAGTAVANTDIKAYITRDGSDYTNAVTLVDQGDTGGHTILTANGVDLTGETSGTSMRWKIETLNQSSSKYTRIQAVSLGWS